MNNESDHETRQETGSAPAAGQSVGMWMMIGFWVLLLGFAILGAQHWLDEREKAAPARIISTQLGEGAAVLIDGSSRGHYRVQGLVNGQEVDFLIDTGATEVAIPAAVAQRLGLRRGARSLASTANGTAVIYDTEIATLQIGSLQRNNVTAHISPGLEGDQALLGMSFLRHFTLLQSGTQLQIQEP